MGINNITLSPGVLAALYPDSLVLVDHLGPAAPAPGKYRFLGKNGRKIIFIVNSPGAEFLPEDQLAFLGKILAACQCSLNDIALINTAGFPVTLTELKKQFNPEMVFICGVPPAFFPLPDSPESFTTLELDGVPVLTMPALETVIEDSHQQLKKKLWACLQKMFRL